MEFLLFFVGIIYANVVEYFVHRYLFHGRGKKRTSVFAFHLRDHHLTAKRNGFIDRKTSQVEAIGLPFLLATHAPVYFVSPALFFGLVVYAAAFGILHSYQHHHPAFTKKYFPWHWDHHMKNQNKSWGVVLPLTDYITGTLENRLDWRPK